MSSAFQSNAFQNNAFQIFIEELFGGKVWKKRRVEPKIISLDSSDLSELEYDKDTNELNIKFKDGSIYNYSNVSNKKVKGLIRAKSHGKYLHNNIKGRYFTTKLKGR